MSHRIENSTAGPVTSVEFSFSAPKYPFVAFSEDGGQAILQEIVPRGDRGYGEFFSILGIDCAEVFARAEAYDPSVEVELLVEKDDGGLFEFVVADSCPAVHLSEAGALPRQIEGVDGEGRITAEIPADVDASEVVDEFLDAHPDAELVAKRERARATPRFGHWTLGEEVTKRLTDRQAEVLQTAYENGYYAWPREITGEELAEMMGIAPPTLHQHLRGIEETLVTMVFEETPKRSPTDAYDR